MMGSFTDITERKKAEEPYMQLFYNNPLPIWIYDPETFDFIEVNEAAIRQYGYSKEEFLSMTIKEVQLKEEPSELPPSAFDTELIAGSASKAEMQKNNKEVWTHKKKNNEIVFVEVLVQMIDFKGSKKIIAYINDITERITKERALVEINERYEKLAKTTSDIFWDWNLQTDEIIWSDNYTRLLGWSLPEDKKLMAEDYFSKIHTEDFKRAYENLNAIIQRPDITKWQDEYRFQKADGNYAFVIDRGHVIRNESGKAQRMLGAMQDVSESRRQTDLLSLERKIFELSSNPQIPFAHTIYQLLEGIENIYSNIFTSVLLLKEDNTLELIAAPRLPEKLKSAIDGISADSKNGSLGAAISQKKDFYVDDIATDPFWKNYKDIITAFGLRSCFSLPIVHRSGHVMGSLSVLHNEMKPTTQDELQVIERLKNILSILLENHRSLQEMKMANERFDVIMKASNDLIWDWNLEKGVVYRDVEGVRKVYGITDETTISDINEWIKRIHPNDQFKMQRTIKEVLKSEHQNAFELEYQFKREDGTYAYVYDRGIIMRNAQGKPYRMIGAAHDITERKRLEKELIDKELEKQRAINQASIDTQEQERTEIGKELHDNVNQVLTTTKLYLELAAANPEMKDQLIEKSTKNIIYVINEIRQLSRSLMNPSLGDLGLIDALKDLAENIHFTKKLHLNLDLDEDVDLYLDENQKVMLFRISQEILNNTIKHAQATTVDVKLEQVDNHVLLIIKDDGRGFDISKVKKGAGLKNIQNRVYLAGGTLDIQSKLGKGSTTIVKCPIKNQV